MGYPVTGPYYSSEIVNGPKTTYGYQSQRLRVSRQWYRQVRPYTVNLPFTYHREEAVSFTGIGAWSPGYINYHMGKHIASSTLSPSSPYPNVYNKAYARFKAKVVSDSASLGIALAQRKQAIDMIALRCLQIGKFASELRKGRFKSAAKAIGLTKPPPRWQKKGKSFADKFLEAHFGWSPLLGDISSAIDVLQNGVPPCRVVGSASGGGTFTSGKGPRENPESTTDLVRWRIQADIKVDNPNLHLANQLGFVNAASVLWDGIPFSFVLGWFVNVEQFLAQYTDFHGLELSNTCVTASWFRDYTLSERQEDIPTRNAWGIFTTATWKYIRVERTTGSIPGPTLQIKDPWILSPLRGLTAASLLLQKLR